MLSSFRLHLIVRHLKRGGVIAYPTEGVYGLGCDPLNARSIARVLEIKGRSQRKGLIVIAARYAQLEPLLAPLETTVKSRMLASWPGPHTWIVPAADFVPLWLRGEHASLAVRVTSHPVAAAICHAFGSPLVSTSANKSGRPPARTPMQVQKLRRQYPDLVYIPGALGGLRKPTSIYDAVTGNRLR